MSVESLILTLSINDDGINSIERHCLVCGLGTPDAAMPERVLSFRRPDSEIHIRYGIHLVCVESQRPQWSVSFNGAQIAQYAATVTLNQKLRQKAE